jgi:glycosyltransferase involved in cell wall biosynthesis
MTFSLLYSDQGPGNVVSPKASGTTLHLPETYPLTSDKKLISIITVVRNAHDVIEKTIQSVISQPYRSLEYIIIDGRSTDGTVDIIRRYSDKLAYWTSEPDEGIYHAMNKALDHVRGKGHLFLNAGDYFVGSVLTEDLPIPCHVPVFKKNVFGRIGPFRPKDHRRGLPYCHQGIIFETKGVRFDTAYRFAADYRYYLDHGYTRLSGASVTGHVYFDNKGISSVNSKARDAEIADIIKRRFGIFWHALFLGTCSMKDMIRPLLRRRRFGLSH